MSHRQLPLSERWLHHIRPLTEAGGAIGGAHDGNLPDLSTISASYQQAQVAALRDAVRELAHAVNRYLAWQRRG